MPAATSPSIQVDKTSAVRQAVAECRHNPLRFVLFAYEWGRGPLASYTGPDRWQLEELAWLTEQLEADPVRVIRTADAAAHGVGKSAKMSWMLQWGMATFPDTRAVATAGTEAQLHSKLRPEFRFWFQNSVVRDWFDLKAETFKSLAPGHEDSWRLDFHVWSDVSEASAGLHNRGKRTIFAVDEASQLPQAVYDTFEGALTDAGTERLFFTSSNTTRNEGPFFEAVEGKQRSRWHVRRIDGERDSDLTDKEWIRDAIATYGEDSDFVKVRIRAQFPSMGVSSFISRNDVDEATRREAVSNAFDPLIMGVDVAAGGEDESIIAFRSGLDARSRPLISLRIPDLMQLASRVAEIVAREKPDGVMVDATGLGLGVYHRLMQLNIGLSCTLVGVNFGAAPIGYAPFGERVLCANRAVELWANMRAWLRNGGAIQNDPDLAAQLAQREYAYRANGALELERKRDMKKRGLSSPDRADALALTFAEHIAQRGAWHGSGERYETDYRVFGES